MAAQVTELSCDSFGVSGGLARLPALPGTTEIGRLPGSPWPL
jgi:hypothetical protein